MYTALLYNTARIIELTRKAGVIPGLFLFKFFVFFLFFYFTSALSLALCAAQTFNTMKRHNEPQGHHYSLFLYSR